ESWSARNAFSPSSVTAARRSGMDMSARWRAGLALRGATKVSWPGCWDTILPLLVIGMGTRVVNACPARRIPHPVLLIATGLARGRPADLQFSRMAIFRSAGEGHTEVVLTAGNPYGSRTLVVERDEDASVAYLCSPDGTVHGACWLANHRPAPAVVDLARINAGLPPLMPRANTLHPEGRRPLAQLTPLWFEEGDGVALYEEDELLAVIPGWADMHRGMPGYARDAVGESPFAWALSEALEGLRPRIANAE